MIDSGFSLYFPDFQYIEEKQMEQDGIFGWNLCPQLSW